MSGRDCNGRAQRRGLGASECWGGSLSLSEHALPLPKHSLPPTRPPGPPNHSYVPIESEGVVIKPNQVDFLMIFSLPIKEKSELYSQSSGG